MANGTFNGLNRSRDIATIHARWASLLFHDSHLNPAFAFMTLLSKNTSHFINIIGPELEVSIPLCISMSTMNRAVWVYLNRRVCPQVPTQPGSTAKIVCRITFVVSDCYAYAFHEPSH
jgi:hypothetical protein